MKPRRILTNRNFPDGKSWEAVEIDDQGRFFWRAVDYSMFDDEGMKLIAAVNKRIEEGVMPTAQDFLDVEKHRERIECCFPCDVTFVIDKFKECGREFDASKL